MSKLWYFPWPLHDLADHAMKGIGQIQFIESWHEDYQQPGKRVGFMPQLACDAKEHELYPTEEAGRAAYEERDAATRAMQGVHPADPQASGQVAELWRAAREVLQDADMGDHRLADRQRLRKALDALKVDET